MKIKTIAPGHILVKAEDATAGVLDTSSRSSAVEKGEVLMVADDVSWVKKGDIVHYKGWGVDIIQEDGERLYYIDIETRAVKGVLNVQSPKSRP
jgi:hypothetical protein